MCIQHGRLHGVPDVIAHAFRRLGVRVLVGGRVAVHDPEELAGIRDHQVRVLVLLEERRALGEARLDVAVVHHLGVVGNLPAEEQVDVAEVDGHEEPAPDGVHLHTPRAGVRSVYFLLALRVVELRLGGVGDHVVVARLREVELRLLHLDVGRPLRRDVAHDEVGVALAGDVVGRRHHRAVPVGVDQRVIDPGAGARGEL